MSPCIGFQALVLMSSLLATFSSRVRAEKQADVALSKCSIHWEVPERGVAKTSFPVKSCLLQCKVSFTDNHYDKMFADVMKVESKNGYCKCLQLNGKPLLRMRGKCPADAQKQCWRHYKKLRTTTYERQYGKETTLIVNHLDLQRENTFDYSSCEPNACKDGDCTEGILPSIWEGRSAEEKSLIADVLQKKKDNQGLDSGEEEMIEHLTPEDIMEIMGEDAITTTTTTTTTAAINPVDDEYNAMVDELSSDTDNRPFTVARLRDMYKKKLQGTSISVDHLLTVAGLTDDDEEVDVEAFRRFVQPEC